MNIYTIPSLIAFISCILLGSNILGKSPGSKLNRTFFFYALLVAYISIAEFGLRQASSFNEALVWLKIGSFWPFAISLSFHFVLVFTKQRKILRNEMLHAIIHGPALAFSILELSTNLLTGNPKAVYWGWTYVFPHNPLSFLSIGWALALLLLSIFLCSKYYLKIDRNNSMKKQQAKLVLISAIIPISFAIGSDGLFPIINMEIPELFTLSVSVECIIIWYAIRKYKLFAFNIKDTIENILSSISEAIFLLSEDYTIQLVNQGALKILGYEKEEIIGKKVEFIFSDFGSFTRILSDKLGRESKALLKSKEGKEIPVRLSIIGVEDRGKPSGRKILLARDVMEQERAEKALKRSLDALERSHGKLKVAQDALVKEKRLASIGEMAGIVAHEINNPLEAIKVRIQLLQGRFSNTECDNKCFHYFGIIDEQVDRISHITRNLLDFSRKKEARSPWSINNIIENIVELMSYRIEKQKVRLTLNLKENLPPIDINIEEMQEVFLNIVQNALDSMRNGGELKISSSMNNNSESIVVEVADTGAGISKSNLDKVFDPFFSTKPDGTGLGLSISKNIVSKHNGKIEVHSTQGTGTKVMVVLPLRGKIMREAQSSEKALRQESS